jgi:phosphate transport system permease protein
VAPSLPLTFAILAVASAAAYVAGRQRAIRLAGGRRRIRNLHSLPDYYGYLAALACALPAVLTLASWLLVAPGVIETLVVERMPESLRALPEAELELVWNDIRNVAEGRIPAATADPAVAAAADHYANLKRTSRAAACAAAFAAAALGAGLMLSRISPALRARNIVEAALRLFLIASSTIAIFTTIGIVLSVLVEAMRFFRAVPVTEFLFGLHWSPQTAIRADQVGSSGAFGAVPLFTGTLLISGIALAVAVPIGLMSAIYLAQYASGRVRAVAKPLLEILAGVPTVVYGFFAALTVGPFIRRAGEALGLDVASESALCAGLVMGVMIIPFVSSLSDDVITAVPKAMTDGSLALGATRSETIRRVVLPAALPGIVASILLAASRAIGETMIVVMAAGLAANLTANPFEAVTTVTVQIVTLLVGDQEFDSPKTLAAFALGLVLFTITLVLNVIALHVVRKYREQYE